MRAFRIRYGNIMNFIAELELSCNSEVIVLKDLAYVVDVQLSLLVNRHDKVLRDRGMNRMAVSTHDSNFLIVLIHC